ncbi:MAG: hypothetical protein JXM70_02885, partial [Pirellulales bacterium]|nr:hypothetical protein [Pirellulales bacterium]
RTPAGCFTAGIATAGFGCSRLAVGSLRHYRLTGQGVERKRAVPGTFSSRTVQTPHHNPSRPSFTPDIYQMAMQDSNKTAVLPRFCLPYDRRALLARLFG